MKIRKTREQDSGHAIIELALVIPVLILLCFAALGASAGISDRQTATGLSKELASLAFRSCAVNREGARYDLAKRAQSAEICLQRVALDFQAEFANAIPVRSAFIVSMYTVKKNGRPFLEGTASFQSAGMPPAGAGTKFSESSFEAEGGRVSELASALSAMQTIVVAEVFTPYAFADVLPINFSFNPPVIYVSSII
ncbi:MAG TPA: pilus assembly protein [Oligoflexia bacterium]|nr:pilus assembly protein [Oligoflexia bacterium]